MSSGLTKKMFVSPTAGMSAAAAAGGFSTSLHNQSLGIAPLGSSQLGGPNTSVLGLSMIPPVGGSGSPVLQSPTGNKFPTGGGPIVFTPQKSSPTQAGPTPNSPYNYPGRGASSFVQSPPSFYGTGGAAAAAVVYSPPPYTSTMVASPGGMPHYPLANHPTSPIAHGYGPPPQYTNLQPYGYGARMMSGSYAFQNNYQPQHHSPAYGHHSPRDEIIEPMHCSPVGTQTQTQLQPLGSQQYQQQLHRNISSPPRPQYMPAFLTGVDAVAAVQTRPRRVFDRSPSTSPPTVGVGGKSPSKATNWAHDTAQQTAAGYGHHSGGSHPGESGNVPGGFTKRSQGQGPSRQLRFADVSNLQGSTLQGSEEKEKKRTGPPIRGFGSYEEITNFLNSPLIKDANESVPGAAITKEAIKNAGLKSPVAESNWITVFGFPAAASSFIYTHFAQYGTIMQRKTNPGGNWLHIEYSSRIEARRALACNGKVLGGTIMVGVITSPKEIVEMYGRPSDKDETNAEPTPSSSSTSTQQSSSTLKSPTLQDKNFESSVSLEPGKPRGIRPLAGSSQITTPVLSMGVGGGEQTIFKQATSPPPSGFSSPKDTQNENVPLPTSSSSMLTKAMEYMFGW